MIGEHYEMDYRNSCALSLVLLTNKALQAQQPCQQQMAQMQKMMQDQDMQQAWNS